ncbi:hypothetical protein ACFL6U_03180 [Planctomycetota bacterium]
MDVNDIDRVKKDIEVIKEAAGLELPFGWEDVWLNIYLIPVGIWLSIWSILPYELSRLWRILPVVLLAPIFVALRIKYRRSSGRSPMKRRQYSGALLACPILGLCGFGYMVWVVRSGHNFVFAVGGMLFFMGLMLAFFAFIERQLYHLGCAIPMMVVGVIISVWPVLNVMDTNVGFVLITACPITAAIQAYQLKRRATINDTD